MNIDWKSELKQIKTVNEFWKDISKIKKASHRLGNVFEFHLTKQALLSRVYYENVQISNNKRQANRNEVQFVVYAKRFGEYPAYRREGNVISAPTMFTVQWRNKKQ